MLGLRETRSITADKILGIVNQGDVTGNLTQQFFHNAYNARPSVAVNLPPDQALPKKHEFLKLLSWRTPVASLVGRDKELDDILDWANDRAPVRVRLLSGPGGSGKSRLAFELARTLDKSGEWTAGFVQPDADGDIEHNGRHLLVILDYAEQYRSQVLRFLKLLSILPSSNRSIRVLLLSRYSLDWWQRNIDSPPVLTVLDAQNCEVSRLSVDDAQKCFGNVTSVLAAHFQQKAPHVSTDQISSWISLNEDLHPLPLFVTAAGIEAVLSPNSILKLSGRELLKALAERERVRIDSLGNRFKDTFWGSRLTALGLLTGGITLDLAKQLAANEPALRLPEVDVLEDAVSALPNWHNGILHPIAPDLVGAQFLVDALDPDDYRSPPCLLAMMRHDKSPIGERLARIAYDVRSLSETGKNPLAVLLEKAVSTDLSAAKIFAETMQNARPTDLLPALLAGSRLMAKADDSPSVERVRNLLRYSVQLNDSGEFDEALTIAEDAVLVASQLGNLNLDPDRRHLANCLNHRSNLLARVRRSDAALQDIEEAVRIRHKLAEANPQEFLPQLAASLQNLSIRLTEVGNQAGADVAIEQALSLYRDLGAEDPEKHARELARTMHNFGVRLHETGDRRGAVAAFREAVRKRQELVKTTPNIDELDLTYSLHSLSQRLLDVGENEEALELARSVLDYRETLLKVYPKRVGLDFLYTYQLVSVILFENGQLSEAIGVAEEGLERARDLARSYPRDFEVGLGFSLIGLGWRRLENGEPNVALRLADQAKAILEPLATRDPARFDPELANCLHARGRFLKDVGELDEAIAETQAAAAIRRRLMAANRVRFAAELGSGLRQLSWLTSISGKVFDAEAFAEEGVSILRSLSNALPLRFELELASSLLELGWRSYQCGHERESLAYIEEALFLFEKHAKIIPLRVQPLLAGAVRAKAIRLSDFGAPSEALSLIEKAHFLYQELSSALQRRRETERFDCAITLAKLLYDNDHVDRALEIADYIVGTRRAAAASPKYEIDLAIAHFEAAHIRRRSNRHENAMRTAAEAEQLFRKLAADEPRRYTSDLCRCLRLLSEIQSDAGYSKRALASLQECILIASPLWTAEPARYLLDQAQDQLTLSRRLRSVPRAVEAREAAEASVALFREAVTQNSKRHLEQLGWALNHLSVCRIDFGGPHEALVAALESLHCMLMATRRMPSKSFDALAVVLPNVARLHARANHNKKARLVEQRVVRICRRFCLESPTVRCKIEIARALTDLSVRRQKEKDFTGASLAIHEAVAIWNLLVEKSSVHKLDLAASLERRSSIEAGTNKVSALRSRQEAQSLYEEVQQWAPVAVELRMANNLQAISDLLSTPKYSLAAINDAIRIFERHAVESYFSLRKLAGALERKGKFLKSQQIILGQIRALQQEVRTRAKLVEERIDGAYHTLIATQEELASVYRETGRLKDALATIEQAKSLSLVAGDRIGKGQIAKIEGFDRSALPLQARVQRRVWTSCRSMWRALRTYGGTGAIEAIR
jgi:tetratricopeptide (TPR) repeat protein